VPEPSEYRSVGFMRGATVEINHKDRQLEKDRAAYKRLRRDGIQPAHVGGSAHMEQVAEMPIEFEMNRTFTKEERAFVREGQEMSREIGLKTTDR
jgi:hypothetical protein